MMNKTKLKNSLIAGFAGMALAVVFRRKIAELLKLPI